MSSSPHFMSICIMWLSWKGFPFSYFFSIVFYDILQIIRFILTLWLFVPNIANIQNKTKQETRFIQIFDVKKINGHLQRECAMFSILKSGLYIVWCKRSLKGVNKANVLEHSKVWNHLTSFYYEQLVPDKMKEHIENSVSQHLTLTTLTITKLITSNENFEKRLIDLENENKILKQKIKKFEEV